MQVPLAPPEVASVTLAADSIHAIPNFDKLHIHSLETDISYTQSTVVI
jgi:hypothetical protein